MTRGTAIQTWYDIPIPFGESDIYPLQEAPLKQAQP